MASKNTIHMSARLDFTTFFDFPTITKANSLLRKANNEGKN